VPKAESAPIALTDATKAKARATIDESAEVVLQAEIVIARWSFASDHRNLQLGSASATQDAKSGGFETSAPRFDRRAIARQWSDQYQWLFRLRRPGD
jgi:hypothetical protein